MGRVSGGKGQGKDFYTLAKPIPWAGVRGIYKDKNICINAYIYIKYMTFPSEIFVFSLYKGILHRIRVPLTHFVI